MVSNEQLAISNEQLAISNEQLAINIKYSVVPNLKFCNLIELLNAEAKPKALNGEAFEKFRTGFAFGVFAG